MKLRKATRGSVASRSASALSLGSVQELTGQGVLGFSFARLSATGLDLLEGLSAMSQLLLNRFHCGRPDKGFWIFIPSRQKLADSLLQVFHAAEGSTADSFGSEFSKPPFHQIQPTGTCRHKVRRKRGCPLSQACTLGCLCVP